MDSPAASAAPKRTRSGLIIGIGAIALLAVAIWIAQGIFGQFWQGAPGKKPSHGLSDGPILNLAQPDALIEASNLSQLPAQIIKAPFLAEILSEDFVFYYEHHAEKLALIGTLRRLAFERNLSLPEQLIAQILNNPAQVALWKTADGRLTLSLARIELGLAAPIGKVLTSFISAAGQIAKDDPQLKSAGSMSLDKDKIEFFSLRYLPGHTLLFAFAQGSLMVASHPDLLSDGAGGFRSDAQTLIGQLVKNQSPFKHHFNLREDINPAQNPARVSLGARFFTLGYQDYVPALAAVRFDLQAGQWMSFIALHEGDHKATFDTSIWASTPADASLCAFMPVSSAALAPIISAQQQDVKILEQFTGRGFICWFANAPMAKPLIGAELKTADQLENFDTQLTQLFDKVIRNNKLPKAQTPASDETKTPVSTASQYAPSNLEISDIEQGKKWQKFTKDGKPLATLARRNNFVLFSLHAALIEHGLKTLGQDYPALQDKLPGQDAVALYIAPQSLSTLLTQEIRQSGADTTLNALKPQLTLLAKKPAVVAQFDAGKKAGAPMSWYSLNWQTL